MEVLLTLLLSFKMHLIWLDLQLPRCWSSVLWFGLRAVMLV